MRKAGGLLRRALAAAGLVLMHGNAVGTPKLPDTVLYGVSYYSEYAPVDRVEQDARMMKEAGINVVRIAESTWGTLERSEGVFDFTHVDRMLAAFQKEGIKVIVGTPTYAIPTWLAREHPNVLVVRPNGRAQYGHRQNMDITDPDFRRAAERVIIKLIEHVKDNPAVIGYQVDNETKAYFTSGPNVQAAFVAHMRKKFPDLEKLNMAFGLDYWSNRINDWADFPSVNGSINASMSNAFADFQRGLVTEYLTWQADLVRSRARPDQFITQNFDLGWKDYSYGVQPEVNHWEAAKPLDIAGVDIYHPSQDKLTGADIAFGGDLTRSLRNGQNYLVMETEAQGFPEWTPYPGQLRLQAFSHLASGANMVGYWHWATTANGIETYWRGLLSQDYLPNEVYAEVKTVGADLQRLGPKLVNLRKKNQVAVYVSNTAQAGFDAFKVHSEGKTLSYNEAMRPYYDALYRMNVEADILSPSSTVPLSNYKLIVVPSLYAASDAEIAKLNAYAKAGGHVVYTFRSGFADEHTKVRYAVQPGAISEAAGISYHQFTNPVNVTLDGNPFGVGKEDNKARWWMEFVTPTTAKVEARYKHPSWPAYAAVTRNTYGSGEVAYVGFMPSDAVIEKIVAEHVKRAGIELPKVRFPLIIRGGTSQEGRQVRYLLNYSAKPQRMTYGYGNGTDLLSGQAVKRGQSFELKPWGVSIIEEN
ncbi:beta-galactosidase [Telluria antibiotica]|nr:beta-galactosidase [Telluria antibiotica]